LQMACSKRRSSGETLFADAKRLVLKTA
jgi:hypothetical protein